jgi:hypothetical protein
MMLFLLGDGANPVGELKGLPEGFEWVAASQLLDAVNRNDLPVRQLLQGLFNICGSG